MKWIKRLFIGEKNDIETSDLPDRVSEIESRISTLRSGLERPKKSIEIPSTQAEPLVDTTQQQSQPIGDERSAKESEMMALKAKLLGKKS